MLQIDLVIKIKQFASFWRKTLTKSESVKRVTCLM